MTPIQAEQTLGGIIRDAIEIAPDNATPFFIAETIAESLDESSVREYLAAMLVGLVEKQIGRTRNNNLNKIRHGGRSAKIERRTQWWENVCTGRVHVGSGQWKILGECTVSDLEFVIEERQGLIEQTQAQIENYLGIITAMKRHGANTVSDLSAEQVAA